jgi:hypothetical protein
MSSTSRSPSLIGAPERAGRQPRFLPHRMQQKEPCGLTRMSSLEKLRSKSERGVSAARSGEGTASAPQHADESSKR